MLLLLMMLLMILMMMMDDNDDDDIGDGNALVLAAPKIREPIALTKHSMTKEGFL